ncbi:MAG: hypothetical protein NT029_15400 [Armatimonadetes bacterium]|nr:hypothetical protein [Armatimonadota bacterium]
MRHWRLIVDGPASGHRNMAADAALLWSVESGAAPPTVRVYEWDGSWLSLGRFQATDRGIDVAECRRLGVQFVRRPTGGRGVLHGSDLTATFCLPFSVLGVRAASVASLYRWCNEALLSGLRALTPVEVGSARYAGRAGDCFASATPADLWAAGGKLLGSAQRRGQSAALIQMSLRWRKPDVDPAVVFVDAAPASYPVADVPRGDIVRRLLDGIETASGMPLEQGGMTGEEQAWADAEEARGAFDVDAPREPV